MPLFYKKATISEKQSIFFFLFGEEGHVFYLEGEPKFIFFMIELYFINKCNNYILKYYCSTIVKNDYFL